MRLPPIAMETKQRFIGLMADLTADIADRPLTDDLAAYLNDRYGPESDGFRAIESACKAGVEAGWLADRHASPGLKFSRPVKPGPGTKGFSVDVVHMADIAGPHHSHPNGEIDMIMPVDGAARFDGTGRGWLVYGPGTAHHPTVSNGAAIILYLLPDGAIEFTPQ